MPNSKTIPHFEALFAQTDAIEQAASASPHRAEQADKSILAWTFREG